MAKEKYFDIVKNERPTLVDFYATWCGPCKMMNPVVKKLSKDLSGKVKIIKVDIDKNQKLAQKLDINSVPTLVIYKNGKIVWRRSGAMTGEKLIKELEKHFVKN